MAHPHQSDLRNRLLTAMTAEDFAHLAPSLESAPLVLRETIVAANEPFTHVYFVEEGLCSLIASSVDGRVEIGMVGREGFVGTSIVLGADRIPHAAIVQGAGSALRIAAPLLVAALDGSPSLRRLLGRYVQSLLVQVGQTVYANADLTLEARLARWILMTQDRVERDELTLTHEFLSIMLGVRRPGVTTATHVLEGAGMIRARRGRIVVLDREKLMDLAGEAYGMAEAEYERLLAEA